MMSLNKTLLLVTASGFLMGCAAPEREDVGVAQSAIIDGRPATASEIFATVALAGTSDGEAFCTGTLVSPTVVVTAAHCLFGDNGAMGAADIEVLAGALDSYEAFADQAYAVSAAVGHSGYMDAADPGPLGKDDDIAVLVLSSPVEGLTPVPVLGFDAIDEYVSAGTSLTISGYGQRDVEASDPDLFGLLYIAETPYQERSDHEMIAGGEGSPDTCTGDSGGPVYVDIEGTKYLLAAVSRASEAGTPPCGRGGVYTLAGAYDDFLTQSANGGYSGAATPDGNSTGRGGGDEDDGGDDEDGCSVSSGSSPNASWLFLVALGAAHLWRRRSAFRRSTPRC